MTNRDYVLLSHAIQRAANAAPHDMSAAELRGYVVALSACARFIAKEVVAVNPNFDPARFLKACGVEG